MIVQPDLRPINTKEFILAQDYTREWREGRIRCRQTTKAGYVTDIASTPAICAPLGFKPDGLHRMSALGHDRRYQRRGIMTGDDLLGAYEEFDQELGRWVAKDRAFTRKQCDELFLDDMLAAGESPGTAKVMYWAVRTFGWMAW